MLSVVLPNFNHAKYLDQSLKAILGQTRPPLELIVIDDASTDDSIERIRPYLDRYPYIRLVRNDQNQGVVKNMNRGLAMARGDMILFAAADDEIYPTFLERGMALLGAYPRAAIFSSRSDIMDAEGRKLGQLALPMPIAYPGYVEPAEVRRIFMRDDAWFMGNATLFRRRPLVDAGGFPEELSSFADGFVSRLLALQHGACFTPEILAAWRRVEAGLAWSETLDMKRVRATAASVSSRIAEAGSLFPCGYAKRWRGRYMFSALRFGLVQAQLHTSSCGAVGRAGAWVQVAFRTAVLFVTLRPWDAISVLRRRLFQSATV